MLAFVAPLLIFFSCATCVVLIGQTLLHFVVCEGLRAKYVSTQVRTEREREREIEGDGETERFCREFFSEAYWPVVDL